MSYKLINFQMTPDHAAYIAACLRLVSQHLPVALHPQNVRDANGELSPAEYAELFEGTDECSHGDTVSFTY